MDSRDIIISLALEYDLPTLLNYCRTSKRINNLVCNNNLFWLSKLKKDFKIILTDISKAKSYYEEISKLMKKLLNINDLYYYAVNENRLDLVKIALDSGADINYTIPLMYPVPPLLQAYLLNFDEVFNYLLERGALNSKEKAIFNITSFINQFQTTNRDERIKLLTIFYEKILPKIYDSPDFKNSRFWKDAALNVLERHKDIIPEVYERRIDEIRALAKD